MPIIRDLASYNGFIPLEADLPKELDNLYEDSLNYILEIFFFSFNFFYYYSMKEKEKEEDETNKEKTIISI